VPPILKREKALLDVVALPARNIPLPNFVQINVNKKSETVSDRNGMKSFYRRTHALDRDFEDECCVKTPRLCSSRQRLHTRIELNKRSKHRGCSSSLFRIIATLRSKLDFVRSPTQTDSVRRLTSVPRQASNNDRSTKNFIKKS
jgi:hypothetical protein